MGKTYFPIPEKLEPRSGLLGRDPEFCVVQHAFEAIGVDFSSTSRLVETLPFSSNDVTVGGESELQTVVLGKAEDVDLAIAICESSYFNNVIKRLRTGETSKKMLSEIEGFVASNKENVWENSWVRFPYHLLCRQAIKVFNQDLRADKNDPNSGLRGDIKKFVFQKEGERYIRVPISYVLKLALADFLGTCKALPEFAHKKGTQLLEHFINDNTSPETHSFYICPLIPRLGNGKLIAQETCLRFLFTQLLTAYTNTKFGLKDRGQEAVVFNSPHPPVRLKRLNNCIPDSFYRELFMSPCLSGWDRGMEKNSYMALCHEVLSRSQLNTLSKLREAGIINRNLVVLPNTSNISLANNGTHLSIGSQKLSLAMKAGLTDFNARHEKYIGDLAIKIFEHFIPLFVGLYSAAPYRMEFYDFHPERALGYLPHQLHYTHLRMFWRRWKKKAKLKIFNKPVTPFGPQWLDKAINRIFKLRGDYIPDYRLIDYMVSLLSTETCPSLDGTLGNQERLAQDLMHLGVFHEKMSPYMFYRLRQFSVMGYTGFEGRFYSLFESIMGDVSKAADLQTLITLFAYKLIATGKVTHRSIPDNPFIESERKQIAFGAAIGIPTFFVREDTGNFYLKNLLKRTMQVRESARYSGYSRVYIKEYQRALVKCLRVEGADLVCQLGMDETLRDLENRIEEPESFSVYGRLTKGILDRAGTSSPFKLSAHEINNASEEYYRNELRFKHIYEGLDLLRNQVTSNQDFIRFSNKNGSEILRNIFEPYGADGFFAFLKQSLVNGDTTEIVLKKVIALLLIYISYEAEKSGEIISNEELR